MTERRCAQCGGKPNAAALRNPDRFFLYIAPGEVEVWVCGKPRRCEALYNGTP